MNENHTAYSPLPNPTPRDTHKEISSLTASNLSTAVGGEHWVPLVEDKWQNKCNVSEGERVFEHHPGPFQRLARGQGGRPGKRITGAPPAEINLWGAREREREREIRVRGPPATGSGSASPSSFASRRGTLLRSGIGGRRAAPRGPPAVVRFMPLPPPTRRNRRRRGAPRGPPPAAAMAAQRRSPPWGLERRGLGFEGLGKRGGCLWEKRVAGVEAGSLFWARWKAVVAQAQVVHTISMLPIYISKQLTLVTHIKIIGHYTATSVMTYLN